MEKNLEQYLREFLDQGLDVKSRIEAGEEYINGSQDHSREYYLIIIQLMKLYFDHNLYRKCINLITRLQKELPGNPPEWFYKFKILSNIKTDEGLERLIIYSNPKFFFQNLDHLTFDDQKNLFRLYLNLGTEYIDRWLKQNQTYPLKLDTMEKIYRKSQELNLDKTEDWNEYAKAINRLNGSEVYQVWDSEDDSEDDEYETTEDTEDDRTLLTTKSDERIEPTELESVPRPIESVGITTEETKEPVIETEVISPEVEPEQSTRVSPLVPTVPLSATQPKTLNDLMGRRQQILVIGDSEIKAERMFGVAKELPFSLTKDRFDLELVYKHLTNFDCKNLYYSDHYFAVIIGPTPHHMKNCDAESFPDLMKQEGYPFSVLARTQGEKVKITKAAFKSCLHKIYNYALSTDSEMSDNDS